MHPLFLVSLKERVRLNHPASEKKTYHLALDLRGHNFHYEVGDCVGVYPTNHPEIVSRILNALSSNPDEMVTNREGTPLPFLQFLTHHANIIRLNKKLLRFLNFEETLPDHLEVVDFLEKWRPKLSAQDFAAHLSPMIPRLYSIASSIHSHPNELHLTVALTQYEIEGDPRYGCCSHYLCHHAPLTEPIIPIYLHKAKEFFLSPMSFTKPIIMIGPGTGVAPFRGFMQERRVKAPTQKNWLFFGERNQERDFYYKDFWKTLEKEGKLRLDAAFSRDGPHKVYVQHLMEKNGLEVWEWLQEGAYLFVCGDASRMAKDVEATLVSIISTHGNLTPEDSKNYIKQMRKEKRYLRDVY
jgi:sulfite reductase (NADPH) flavoprotein alpha-component